jgi:DNA-binding SARP family transcriptional activator
VGAGSAGAPEVLDALEQLVDHSLLTVRVSEGVGRYSILEPLRQLGAAELTRDPEEESSANQAHASEMLKLVRVAEPHFLTSQRRAWAERLGRELDNLRTALARSRASRPDLYAELAAAAWWFWFSTRHWTEARRWLEDAARIPEEEVPPATLGKLRFALGALDALQARPDEARERLESAIRIAGEVGDEQARAYALNYLGMAHAQLGRPEAIPVLEEARAWFEAHQDLYGLRLSLLLLGTAMGAGGEMDRAIRSAQRGVDVARVFGQDRELAVALQTLAGLELRAGNTLRAEELFKESLRTLLTDPADMFTARAFHLLGVLRGREGRTTEAGRLIGVAEALRERIGAPPFELDRTLIDAEVARLRSGPDAAAFDRARTEGRHASVDDEVRRLCGTAPDRGESRREDGSAAPPAPTPEGRHDERRPPGDGTAPGLDVRILGPLEVRLHGAAVDEDAWSYAKPRELLVYLTLHPAGGTRHEIAAALWPDADVERLKNSFHVTLHHLRKALGDPAWVVIDRDRYRFRSDRTVTTDLARFETALEDLPPHPGTASELDAYRDALLLYRGDALGDFPGSRWYEPVADRARRAFARAAHRLAAGLQAADLVEEATDVYQRMVTLDALDEEAHRGLMRTLALTGHRAQALRQFERLRALLERELEAQPEPETMALWESLRATEGGVSI